MSCEYLYTIKQQGLSLFAYDIGDDAREKQTLLMLMGALLLRVNEVVKH